MSNSIKVGFIGTGNIAQGHLQNLAANPAAEVAAVCDVNETAARTAAADSGARVYNDYRKMIEEEKLDAVYICVPPFVHGDLEFALIERGLPFFVQKPVALDLPLANRIAEAVRAKKLITCVGYQLRYSAAAEAARAALAGKRIALVTGSYWCGTANSAIPRWWLWRATSGGQLVEQATHVVDMMRFLAGEIEEVFCWENQLLLDKARTDCPDTTALTLRFANGALGTLSCTTALEPDDWEKANVLDISFETSRLHWAWGGITVSTGIDHQQPIAAARNIDDDFIESVRTGDPSLIRSNYDEGVRTLAVTLAAGASHQRGCAVKVGEFIGEAER